MIANCVHEDPLCCSTACIEVSAPADSFRRRSSAIERWGTLIEDSRLTGSSMRFVLATFRSFEAATFEEAGAVENAKWRRRYE